MQVVKQRPYRIYILILLFVIAGVRSTYAQIDTGLSNTMQRSIDSLLLVHDVKGISAAAYIPGKGMWKGVTGVSHGSVPIDTNMLFGIGSITKTFIAAEILKIVESGSLSLTDTLGALLPPMTNVNPSITVKQLLGHTSGMGDFLNASWQTAVFSNPTSLMYFPDALTAFCGTATGGPGSSWNYCNANYSLLGMIIESKKGDSLHKVLRHDFIAPYNLNNTYMEAFEHYGNATPHNWISPTLNPSLAVDSYTTPREALWSSVEPAGGYFADAADMAKWGYNLYSGNVISASSLSQMLTFTTLGGSYFNGYGLGAMRFVANGRTYYGHGGNYYGYASSMLYYPKDSICIAVLINQDCIGTYDGRALINALIKQIATSIDKQSVLDKSTTISPNPANEQLNVHIAGFQGSAIEIAITDITGKTVYNSMCHKSEISINTARYESGTYFIRLSAGKEVVTRQIVVTH